VSQKGDDGTSVESETAIERPSVKAGDAGGGGLAAGTVLAGRYEVRRSIGRGGMGFVVEALDRALGVLVAIKIVRGEYGGEREWSARLAREVKLARQIHHPNVCRVFDFAQADGRAFLIMELAAGGTLRDERHAAAARARPLSDRISDARALAAGLAAIHAAGIVHRDISPQNALRMGDGRLVLSDFGLATDAFDGTTSIHGGTVAYMAPEVLRGGRASVAADLWSLGAVIHEVVFGERLKWSTESGGMRSPAAARALSPLERSVLEICYACVAPEPARRPRSAAEVAARLSDAGLARSAGRRTWRRAAVAVLAVGAAVLAVVGVKRVQASRKRAALAAAAPAPDPLMIIPTGEPEDWTDKAKVLAEVPGAIRCLVPLPDNHTVRFMRRDSAHAEDLDTRTGERKLSPLVPDAYAEGCPSLSPDGRRLVYVGHTGEGRAFAFVSEHPDGRDAVPEVQTAEPSFNSDPVWLADGESFVYDLDEKGVGVFSMITKRSAVVPSVTTATYTAFHEVVGGEIFVNAVERGPSATDIIGFSYPHLEQVVRWRVPEMVTGLASRGAGIYYYSSHRAIAADLVEVRSLEKRARRVGRIRGVSIERSLFVDGGLLLETPDSTSTLVFRVGGLAARRVPTSELVGLASRCGEKIIAVRYRGRELEVVWLDNRGNVVGPVSQTRIGTYPSCSSDGSVIFYSNWGEHAGIERCDRQGCRPILQAPAGVLAVSPDDRRLAFTVVDSGGVTVRWMSTDGTGGVHQITETDNVCDPLWASNKNVWVSFRKGREHVWTEIDTDTGQRTGRTFRGSNDCADGLPDPLRPVYPPIENEVNVRTQFRLLSVKDLPAG
jgi:serine/threonine protein kinase